MIKNILIPADGSPGGDIALEYGIYIALKLKALISGIHVLDINLMQGPVLADISGGVVLPPYDCFFSVIKKALNEKADFVTDNFYHHCQKAGLKAEIKKMLGRVDEIIIEEAVNADFILMAKQGEQFYIKDQSRLGSVVESVIRKSGKPVMITPDNFRKIESMGIAYDGSPAARKALDYSLDLSKQANWPLTALIVTTDREKATRLTSQIEEPLQAAATDYDVIILSGKEGPEIIKFIKEDAVELMVMGAYGHNRLRELLLGSTTAQVIHESPIPVLLTH